MFVVLQATPFSGHGPFPASYRKDLIGAYWQASRPRKAMLCQLLGRTKPHLRLRFRSARAAVSAAAALLSAESWSAAAVTATAAAELAPAEAFRVLHQTFMY